MSFDRFDTEQVSALLQRPIAELEVESEPAMDLRRLVALRFSDGGRFPLPTGNALRSAGEVFEIRALLAGLPRRLPAAGRRALGPGDPRARDTEIEAMMTRAIAEPDHLLDELEPGQPR